MLKTINGSETIRIILVFVSYYIYIYIIAGKYNTYCKSDLSLIVEKNKDWITLLFHIFIYKHDMEGLVRNFYECCNSIIATFNKCDAM